MGEGSTASTTKPSTLAVGVPDDDALEAARRFAAPLLTGRQLDTGEPALSHADGVEGILASIGAGPALRAAVYLVYAADFLSEPETVIGRAFGSSYASLVGHTRKLVQAQRSARDALADQTDEEVLAIQLERVRKMLLAFSQDLRVVLLRLASRLQTLRFYAASKQPCPRSLAHESQKIFAPLANRLGIWQIKWEIEDLSFRFLDPVEYKRIAGLLEQTRLAREASVQADRTRLEAALADAQIDAEVLGRPKHIFSIWKKMQGKQLPFERVLDVRALRVLVEDVPSCYAALSRVHELWAPMAGEFDDYIARPKANGYQSLHTVVIDDSGRPLEVQVRTRAMHEHAESGVAAHWAYKEAGTRGYAGVVAAGAFEEQLAQARRAVLDELLAWERECADGTASAHADGTPGARLFEDRIYVFTPQGSLIELGAGATPIDFAYAVHTQLGHRCRGAKIDGAMVPLNTALRSGQTVEIVATKEGGPSLDWLNPQLGYLASQRSRAKARAWFNARAQQETIARGREAVDKVLQREGRTSVKLEELAARLGFRSAEALFETVGKDEFSLRNIEQVLRPSAEAEAEEGPVLKPARSDSQRGTGVLVVGVKSLMTQLSRCCRPAPPDAICGYVTRGKGVAVHREDCSTLRQLRARDAERIIAVAWGQGDASDGAVYPVEVAVLAHDRQGLLRDISDVFAKERINVIAVNTRSQRGVARMTFTVEVRHADRLRQALGLVMRVPGVESAHRR